MKVRVLFVAAGMALALPLPALAGDRQQQNGLGHYEWRSAPQFGPRATGPARKRVWVAHNPKMPNCDCDMMKMSANACMKSMHDHKAAPSAG